MFRADKGKTYATAMEGKKVFQNLKTVLQRLRETMFFMKRSKREFATEEIESVGPRVFARGEGYE